MTERPFLGLARWAVARPRQAILVCVLVTLAAVPGLLRLQLRTDGNALVPPDDPVVPLDAEIREHFGLRDQIIVYLESRHPDGIYNRETLRRLKLLTQALAGLPGVGAGHVMSLGTERRDRVFRGEFKFRTFLDPMPDTPELIAQLQEDIQAGQIPVGTLVSADGRAAAILVGVPPSWADGRRTGEDRTVLYRKVLAAIAPLQSDADRILVVGAPVAESLLGRHLIQDLTLLVPLGFLVIAVIMGLGCRRVWGVGLGLLEVGACLVFTFGLMGWLGVPVHLTTATLPVILTTIGLADEIHLFWHYQRRLAAADPGPPHPGPVEETMRQMVRPLVLTSLTTIVGFLSFLTSPIPPVRVFGVFAAVGILFCLGWSLTAVPAVLSLLSPERLRHPRDLTAPGRSWTVALVAPVIRRRGGAFALLALATLAVGAGARHLEVQDSWVDGFAPGSPFRTATDRVNATLNGTHLLLAHLTLDSPPEQVPQVWDRQGPLLDHTLLRAIGAFEAYVRALPEVGGVIGAHTHLTTMAYLWSERRPGTRRIPDHPQRVNQLLKRFDLSRGEARRREVIDDDLRRTVVTIFLKNANYQDTAALMHALRAYERRHLAPLGARLDFAGDVAVSQAMIPAIVRTQITSLLLAIGAAFATICLLYRSLVMGVYALLPVSVAVCWAFGTMGWLGIPLGVATSMFCAITLGIGVDYAIHFVERVRRARAAGRPDPARRALEEAGPAIATDTLAIALGFGLLALSQVPANARLGLLVTIALLVGCTLTLVGLGAWFAGRPVPARDAAPRGAPGERRDGQTSVQCPEMLDGGPDR